MLLSVPAIVRSGLRGGLIPTQAGLLSFSRSTTRKELPASKVVVSGLARGSPLALATHSTLDTLHYSRPWKPVSKIKWKSKFWGENMACAATRTRGTWSQRFAHGRLPMPPDLNPNAAQATEILSAFRVRGGLFKLLLLIILYTCCSDDALNCILAFSFCSSCPL